VRAATIVVCRALLWVAFALPTWGAACVAVVAGVVLLAARREVRAREFVRSPGYRVAQAFQVAAAQAGLVQTETRSVRQAGTFTGWTTQ
jgi:hypothetical protein